MGAFAKGDSATQMSKGLYCAVFLRSIREGLVIDVTDTLGFRDHASF